MNDNSLALAGIEDRWVNQLQQAMLALFHTIPLAALKDTFIFLSPKTNYSIFIRHLRKTGSTHSKLGSLLEVAEHAAVQIQLAITQAEEIWEKMPQQLKTRTLDQELLEQLETQLNKAKEASEKLIIPKLKKFIDNQYLDASKLYPLFQELCKICNAFLNFFQDLLKTILSNIKNLNPNIEENDLFKKAVAVLELEKSTSQTQALSLPTPQTTPEEKWVKDNINNLIVFFHSKEHTELCSLSHFLYPKVAFQSFQSYLILKIPGRTFSLDSILVTPFVRCTEQLSVYIQQTTPVFKKILTEQPLLDNIDERTQKYVKNFVGQLDEITTLILSLEQALHKVITNINSSEEQRYLIFQELCNIFSLYLVKTVPQSWRAHTPASELIPVDILKKHIFSHINIRDLTMAAQVNHRWRIAAHQELRHRLTAKGHLSFWAISSHQPPSVFEECLQLDSVQGFSLERVVIRMTLLQFACKRGLTKIARLLIAAGASTGGIKHFPRSWTSLQYACANGRDETVRFLIEETDAKKELAVPCTQGFSLFKLGLLSGNKKLVQYFFENKLPQDGSLFLEGVHTQGHFELEAYLTEHITLLFSEAEKNIEAFIIKRQTKDKVFFAALAFLSFIRIPDPQSLMKFTELNRALIDKSEIQDILAPCLPFMHDYIRIKKDTSDEPFKLAQHSF